MKEETSQPIKLSTESEAATIAALAVQMLTPIELPTGWDSMTHQTLLDALTKKTLPDPTFPGIPSAFETIAEEAVSRAKILMRAARGEKRPEREDFEKLVLSKKNQGPKERKGREECEALFYQLSPQGTELPLSKALDQALPGRTSPKVKSAFTTHYQKAHPNARKTVNSDDFEWHLLTAKTHWNEHKNAIQKSVQRAAGRKGANKESKKMQP